MHYDYLIIGEGLAGTFLSWNLSKAGKKILVIDAPDPFTASKVASGVINPVTGRRMVRTWQIETLMPFAVDAYSKLGEELEAKLIRQCNIIDFHPTPQMKLAFQERLPEESEYLHAAENEHQWREQFNYDFGFGETSPCWLIDLNAMMEGWRKKLLTTGSLLEEKFLLADCRITPDAVHYKDISANKLFFCDGVAGFDNPYFHLLPYARNKGQALIVEIPGLPRDHIFKQGINIVPWKADLFWVGSSYEWDFTDTHPSPEFREKIEKQLKHWLKLPYRIVDHLASERPANMERRPFVGLHPQMPSIGILNGMGTKGCTLAPYFADQLAGFLQNGTAIEPLADVQRFSRILSRGSGINN
jgi:glycine/D-amino acid oxidase-like deaminating enzyme